MHLSEDENNFKKTLNNATSVHKRHYYHMNKKGFVIHVDTKLLGENTNFVKIQRKKRTSSIG